MSDATTPPIQTSRPVGSWSPTQPLPPSIEPTPAVAGPAPTSSIIVEGVTGGRISSHEQIWGKAILSHGYTGVPSILIQAQVRLKLNAVKMNIILQLLDYWRSPERRPFPSKRELAERIDITQKTVQNNIRAMEKEGLIQRVARYTRHRDPDSNVYNLDGLIKRLRDEIEPEFSEARKKRQEERRRVERGPRRA